MSPIIHALEKRGLDSFILHTGQHGTSEDAEGGGNILAAAIPERIKEALTKRHAVSLDNTILYRELGVVR